MTEVGLAASRLRIHQADGVLSARRTERTGFRATNRIDRACAAAAQVHGQRGSLDRVSAVLAGFQRVLLDRAVNQAQVVDTGVFASRFTSFDEVRNSNRGQETDDCHNDHDFNERKARLA